MLVEVFDRISGPGQAIKLLPQAEHEQRLIDALLAACLDGGVVAVAPQDGGPPIKTRLHAGQRRTPCKE